MTQIKDSAGSVDESSPLFLHSSENPSLVLVSPSLNGKNYHTWSRSMLLALRSKNKLQFIDGTVKPPLPNEPQFAAWERCNTMLLSWFFHSIESSIAQSLIWFDNAAAVWEDLKERFGQGDSLRILDLKREISSLRQGALNVNDYFTLFKTITEQLEQFRPIENCHDNCTAIKNVRKHYQNDQAIMFLMGLNDNYENFRAQILIMDPLPPVGKVLALTLQHERNLLKSAMGAAVSAPANITAATTAAASAESAALAAQGPSNYRRNGGKRPYCTHCNRPGHTIEKCYKLHGYPPGHPLHNSSGGRNPGKMVNHSASHSEGGAPQVMKDISKLQLTQEQYSSLISMIQQHSTDPTNGKGQSSGSPTGYPAQAHNVLSYNPYSTGHCCPEDDW